MSYTVELIANSVQVGDIFINCSGNSATLIKELCGRTPPFWHNKSARDLIPILERACWLLKDNSHDYRCFELYGGYSSVESTLDFLETVLTNCKKYPDAVLQVGY